jgi:pimeloyl-ACP methyl ester carboxylesterase
MLSFLRRDPRQMLRSWYIGLFQLPRLPEMMFRAGDFSGGVRALRASAGPGTFSEGDMCEYRTAWSRPGAVTSMINWYRALARHRPELPRNPRVQVPTMILWGVRDVALSRRMVPPSLALCEDGRVEYFETATHWVQHDCPKAVSDHLIRFFGD